MSKEVSDFLSKMSGTYQAQEMLAHKQALHERDMKNKETTDLTIKEFLASYNAVRTA